MLHLQCMLLYYRNYNSHHKGLEFLMLMIKSVKKAHSDSEKYENIKCSKDYRGVFQLWIARHCCLKESWLKVVASNSIWEKSSTVIWRNKPTKTLLGGFRREPDNRDRTRHKDGSLTGLLHLRERPTDDAMWRYLPLQPSSLCLFGAGAQQSSHAL